MRKKIIVLINTGNSMEMNSWIEYTDAVIYMGYLGLEKGNVIAEVLSGQVNPSGKLKTFDVRPTFVFGYGLSYASFEYSNLLIAKREG